MEGEAIPKEDSAYRFTYKVVHTYCVQSTAPILPEQLVADVQGASYQDRMPQVLEEHFRMETGGRSHVYLANIHAEETDGVGWSLF